jgi:hypothetical protein
MLLIAAYLDMVRVLIKIKRRFSCRCQHPGMKKAQERTELIVCSESLQYALFRWRI